MDNVDIENAKSTIPLKPRDYVVHTPTDVCVSTCVGLGDADLDILCPSFAVEGEGLFRGVKQSVTEEVGTDHDICSSLQ